MSVEDWLRQAEEDAIRRGLDELKPLLETLARSTAALRRAADERLASAGADESRGRT
jgi:hypothetical protein